MNKIVVLILVLLVAFTSHSYGSVVLKSESINPGLQGWLKSCATFQKIMPDVQQFFGCPTIEKFSYKTKSSLKEVEEAVNKKFKLKMEKMTSKKGVDAFFHGF